MRNNDLFIVCGIVSQAKRPNGSHNEVRGVTRHFSHSCLPRGVHGVRLIIQILEILGPEQKFFCRPPPTSLKSTYHPFAQDLHNGLRQNVLSLWTSVNSPACEVNTCSLFHRYAVLIKGDLPQRQQIDITIEEGIAGHLCSPTSNGY